MNQNYIPALADDDVTADLGGGQFLGQSDFKSGTGITFRIARAHRQTFEAKNNWPAEPKWVLTFEGDRRLSLNRTNLRLMAKWFGTRPSAWIGQRITVYVDESVSFGGRLVGGLRIRKPLPSDEPAF